jgi:hypothetical protein
MKDLVKRKSFWVIAISLFSLFCLADNHFSFVDGRPEDGDLTIGFPLAYYYDSFGLVKGGGGWAEGHFWNPLSLIVDLLVCIGAALLAAGLFIHFARNRGGANINQRK